jgi:hypothetical protein
MIEKVRDGKSYVYTPTCDICGDTLEPEDEWNDALEAMRYCDWEIKKLDDGYEHVCNECRE